MKPATATQPRTRQGELGQFLTAEPVAELMASMFGTLPKTVRLLDAGAGAGALTQAFVTRICEGNDGVEAIEVSLYELDLKIIEPLAVTMKECQRRCKLAGVRFKSTIHPSDFIQDMSARLVRGLFGGKAAFNCS